MIDLAPVAAEVRARPARHAVRLIGVDGPAGSGKSTLTARLSSLLDDAPIVQTDDFCSWSDVSGWWPVLREEVINPLLAGREARYQVRDWVGDEFGDSRREWKTTPAAPFVIVEGVTATRREFADALVYAIWVEAPASERLKRGLDRDGERNRPYWQRWMADEARFFAMDDTRARADLIVDTGN